MGSIYFKLSSWNQNNFESVPIDSNAPQISIGELKQLISKKKKLGSNTGLIVTNAQTNEEYKHETDTIQRNSSVIIKLVPNYSQPSNATGSNSSNNSTQSGPRKVLPPGYVCHRCGALGSHHISECPTNGDPNVKKKPQTMHGVPKSFLNQDTSKGPSFKPNEFEFDKAISAAGLMNRDQQNTLQIPEELKCSLCNKLLRDAVTIPCCKASSCDECIRSALLEEENDFHCPLCREPVIPDNLLPNQPLRRSVEDFLASGQIGSDPKSEGKERKEKRNRTKRSPSPPEKKTDSTNHERESGKESERSRDRSRDRNHSSREREKSPSNRERSERERSRESERSREREKSPSNRSDKSSTYDRERERERERSRDREKEGRSREREDRRDKRDDKDDRKRDRSRTNRESSPNKRDRTSDKRSRH